MSRLILEDFERFKEFLNNYNIPKILLPEKQIEECKAMHKKLYALMIFSAECHIQKMNRIFLKYIDEMISDLLLTIFCWIQGMYKTSKLEIRCSIENYLKAVISETDNKISDEKSVYKVFDKAKVDKHFNRTMSATCLDQFNNDYSLLCHTVHSDLLQLHSISALNLLPQYESKQAHEIQKLYIRIAENFLVVLYLNYPDIIDRMHPENKVDFLDCISKSHKRGIIEELYG